MNAKDMNIFQLLGVEICYDLDLGVLHDNYRKLQQEHHPDLFVNKPESERAKALLFASQLNDAFNRLKDPITRALALLELLSGQEINFAERTSNDVEFLMQQLEYQEQLEEIKEQGESCQLFEFQDHIAFKMQELESTLKQSFDHKDFDQSLLIIDRMRYMSKLLGETELIEEQLISS